MRTIFSLFVAAFIVLSADAHLISPDEAKNIAIGFFNSMPASSGRSRTAQTVEINSEAIKL